ncbi:MAG: hypothetical protein KGL39_33210 [Patescibacteria group bacterium]|nr:hypothetical protein [Patescibacteria group bacterium]
MSTEKVAYPQTERQRKLQQVSFDPSTIMTRDLPRDTVLKGIHFRLSGSIVTTFPSGTPIADALSTLDNLIPRIDVVVGGSRTVKSVRPYLLRMQQMLSTKILAERKSSAGSAAAKNNNPTADSGFVYGTTTQYTTVAESVYLPFEMIWADQSKGREATWLNLKGVPSAELRFTGAAESALLGFGNSAPVTYSSDTFVVDITTVEAQDVPPQIVFSDWKQTTKTLTFAAQTTDYLIDINRGNKLSGLWFLTRDGAAGSSTTASGKLLDNNVLARIQLLVNGQTTIKDTTFQQLQAENRLRSGVYAPFSSNVSLLDGVAFMNLLARNDASTALDVAPPMVDQVQVSVDTNDSSIVDYTNPAEVTIQTDEIVVPR